jgi:hypothetical protein
MMDWPRTTGKVLAWVGIAPFILAVMAIFAHKIFALIGFVPIAGSIAELFVHIGDFIWPALVVLISSYTALIIAFIAGGQWTESAHLEQKSAAKFLWLSNFSTLFAWFGMLIPSWVISFSLLMLCLWLVYLVDFNLYQRGCWNKAYMKMRFGITLVVSICLLTLIFLGRPYF